MQKKLLITTIVTGLILASKCMSQVQTFTADFVTNFPNYQENFILTTNGEYIWNTSYERYWRHCVWSEMTNGWRVVLYPGSATRSHVSIAVGSLVTNAGPGYLEAPYHKFAKFELLDPNGKIVQTKPNAGTNLFKVYYSNLANLTNPPPWASPTNGALAVDFPETIWSKDYPQSTAGFLVGDFGFSLGEPAHICEFVLTDLFSITNEGDYKLTVRPVLYAFDPTKYGSANYKKNIQLQRVDLIEVSAKIHLVPNVK
jgi:hypothetical protein